ncbi:MAG: VCBS repeat-containing protein, partial [Planctomycetota bacterium]
DLAFEKQDGDALRCLNRASSAVDGFGPAIGNDLMRGPIVMTSDVDGDLQTETVYVDWKLNAPSRAARVVRRRTRPGGVVGEEVLASWPDLRPFDFVPDRPLVFGDLDADGFADAVALLVDVPAGSELQVLRGTPTGGLGAPATVALTFEGTGDPVIVRDDMAPLVDVDGDGFLDLALEAIAPPALVLCPGNGAGGFGPCRTIATPTNPDRFDRPEFADLDGDGLLDVHYFRDFDFGSGAWADLVTRRGGPGGTLGPETPFGAGVHYLDTALADVDGDGITDLLALRFFPAMGGEGATELVRFHSPFDPAVPRQVIGPAPFARQVDVLDADADGDLDVVVLGPDGFRLHTNLGGASFSGSPTFLPAGADAGVHLTVGDRDGDGDEDLFWSSSTTGASGVVENVSLGSIGAPECSPAVPNSTGSSGRIRGAGSTELGIGRTRLVVDRLPAGVTTLFLASRTAGATPVMGSVGTLCLGGAIGRFNGPGEIGSTTASGFRVLDVDLDAIPRPNALVAAAPGETWRFSAWHRDTVAGQATSNFTDAVAISFQ